MGAARSPRTRLCFDLGKARIPEFQCSRSRNWIVAHEAMCTHLWHRALHPLKESAANGDMSVQVINGTHPLDTVCRHFLHDGTMRTTVARSASGQYLAYAHGTRGLCFRYLWFGEPVGALQETLEGVEELARRRTIIRRFGFLFFNRCVDVTPT